MTDQVKTEAAMTLVAESMRLAKTVETLLPQILPLKNWDAAQKAFRHSPEAKETGKPIDDLLNPNHSERPTP